MTQDLIFGYQRLGLVSRYTLVFFREALAQPGAERRGGPFAPPPPNWRWVYQAPNWRGKFINATVNVPKVRQKPTVIFTRSFRRLDIAALNHDLLDVDWENVFAARTVSDQWDAFLSSFVPVIEAHAPLRRVTIRNPTAPPVSAATRDLMSQRRDALQRLGRKSTAYKDLNRMVRAAVRRDRREEMRWDIDERGPDMDHDPVVGSMIPVDLARKIPVGSMIPCDLAGKLQLESMIPYDPAAMTQVGSMILYDPAAYNQVGSMIP